MMVVSSLKDMTALIGRVAARFMGMAVGNIHKDRLIDHFCSTVSLNIFLLKELKEMVALLEAICHEMQQGLSIMNPGPMTCQVIDSTASSHCY
jgi:hypothetical protein